MLRRIFFFVLAIAIVAAIAALVYMNPQQTSFSLTPQRTVKLPVSLLSLAAMVAGMVLTFIVALFREGRRAVREWRVFREKRAAERHVELKSEARFFALAGNFNKARTLLKKATERSVRDVDSLVAYAETYLLEGKPEDAKRALEEGQAQFGNDPVLLFAMARTHRALDENGAAVTALERSSAAFPDSLQVLEPLRDILIAEHEWKKASEVQQRICDLRPNNRAERNRLLGTRLEAARDEDPAARDTILRSILGSDSSFTAAILERARIMREDGAERKASRLLEKFAAKTPRVELLDALEQTAGVEEADRVIKLYKSLVQSAGAASPVPPDAIRLRAARYLLTHERATEAADILKVVESVEFERSSQLLWGMIHQAAGNWDLASVAYEQALDAAAFPRFEYRCGACSAVAGRTWRARCEACGLWSTLTI